MFEKIEGKSRQNDVKPSAEKSRNVWSKTEQNVEHNENTEWLDEVKEKVSREKSRMIA